MTKLGAGERATGVAERRWEQVFLQLSAAEAAAPLGPSDLERLAMAAHFTGRDDECADAFGRAHQAFLNSGEPQRAARSAFWLAFTLMGKGDSARAAGWLARARRLLDERDDECVEQGYLLLPAGIQHVRSGDVPAAAAAFARAAEIGERFGDPDLVSLARQGHGRTLIALGKVADGMTLLDEVMVAVTSGELSPIVSGTIYCSVISACFDVFDIRRAQEWTEALDRWCKAQPDLVPFRGECLVQRAEIMRLHGIWPDALEEARRACDCLAHPPGQPALGAAFYQMGELHRLRGDFAKAEEAYAAAGQAGRMPQPGLALLRLSQGRVDAAKAAITRALDEARDPRMRSRLLAPAVEILLAAGEGAAARDAAARIESTAADAGTPFLRATAAHAFGAVLLAEGDANGALRSLRIAWTTWRDLAAPYEMARTAALIGAACLELGDADSARIELKAAIQAFHQLGAATDAAQTEDLLRKAGGAPSSQLTGRELEVLRLVASGKTNRAIARELTISEKTVARHLSNIFNKLDLSSRAAATAYAFKHHLA